MYSIPRVDSEAAEAAISTMVSITETMAVATDPDGVPVVTISGRLVLESEGRRRRRRLSESSGSPPSPSSGSPPSPSGASSDSLLSFSDDGGVERFSLSNTGTLRTRDASGMSITMDGGTMSVRDPAGRPRVTMEGGAMRVLDNGGMERVRLGADDSDEEANASATEPVPLFRLRDEHGVERVALDAATSNRTRRANMTRPRRGLRLRDPRGEPRLEAGDEDERDGSTRNAVFSLRDETGRERVAVDAADDGGWSESGLRVVDRVGGVRVRMAAMGNADVAIELKDSSNATRLELRPQYGLTVSDSEGRPRSSLGAGGGLSLLDANGTFRFSADTVDENFTRVTLMDATGSERIRLHGSRGSLKTFDADAAERLSIDEDGSLRVLDGQVEALVLNKYGMQGLDPYGNVTLAFDRLAGRLDASGPVAQASGPIPVDGIRGTYAQFCTRDTYPTDAAKSACESSGTTSLIDRLGLTAPTQRTAQGMTYTRPTSAADGVAFDPNDAINAPLATGGGGGAGYGIGAKGGGAAAIIPAAMGGRGARAPPPPRPPRPSYMAGPIGGKSGGRGGSARVVPAF